MCECVCEYEYVSVRTVKPAFKRDGVDGRSLVSDRYRSAQRVMRFNPNRSTVD